MDRWTIKIVFIAFFISFLFSFGTETIMPNVGLLSSIIILLVFIIIGILFDMIGVAVTTCDIKPFHSMSSKKIRSARIGIKLIQNADKVSSFCNDVIGDICGIISGSCGVIIANNLSTRFNFNLLFISLFVTSFIASLTIGGKAFGKKMALNNNVGIINVFSRVLSIFVK